jgi:hypothetical protein
VTLVLRAEDAPAHAESEHRAILGHDPAEERSLVGRCDRRPGLAPIGGGQDRSRLAQDQQLSFAQLQGHVEVLVVLRDLAAGPALAVGALVVRAVGAHGNREVLLDIEHVQQRALLRGGGEDLRPRLAAIGRMQDHRIVADREPERVVEEVDRGEHRLRRRLRPPPRLAEIVRDHDVAVVAHGHDAVAEALRVHEQQALHRLPVHRAGVGQDVLPDREGAKQDAAA